MEINNAQLRQFLQSYFDGEELRDLCFDYFPRVEQEFTGSMVKSAQIRLLLNHCRNYGERDRLIAALRELRPDLFQQEFELAQPEPTSAPSPNQPTNHNPHQIFISHAYEDADLAHRLASDLRQHGWHVWIAPDSILPGEKWVSAINRGLAESGVFLLLVSQHAVQSEWVNSETNIAIHWEHEGKLRFVPLQINSRSVNNIPPLWQTYQFISFGNHYQDDFVLLLKKLVDYPNVLSSLKRSETHKPTMVSRLVPAELVSLLAVLGFIFLISSMVLLFYSIRNSGTGDNGEVAREVEATYSANIPAAIVETYLQAKIEGDNNIVRQLLCTEMEPLWEREADTFANVSEVNLENMACTYEAGSDKVNCNGKIVVVYGSEETEFPLVSYRVIEEDNAWKWCGEAP